MDVLEHGSVDFYDFTVPPQPIDDPDVLRFGSLHARAARNGARHGTPVILSPSGRPDHEPGRRGGGRRDGAVDLFGDEWLQSRKSSHTTSVWLALSIDRRHGRR